MHIALETEGNVTRQSATWWERADLISAPRRNACV